MLKPLDTVLCRLGRHRLRHVSSSSSFRPLFTCTRCRTILDDDGQVLLTAEARRPWA